jgi:hypothetical protein
MFFHEVSKEEIERLLRDLMTDAEYSVAARQLMRLLLPLGLSVRIWSHKMETPKATYWRLHFTVSREKTKAPK